MYDPDLEGTISLLRVVRWLFFRLAAFILAVRGISFLGEGRTGKGILELAIATCIILLDLFVIGHAIRKRKRLLKDPEYRKKVSSMPRSEELKRDGKGLIIMGIIWMILSISLIIILPIVTVVKTAGDLAFCLSAGIILTSLGLFILIKGIREHKNAPKIAAAEKEKAAGRDDGTLYRDFELTFEPAKAQYCKQTGKSEAELTDADNDAIREYAYAPISYLFAWVTERDFYQPAEDDAPHMSEPVAEIKARVKLPSFYIGENEGTIYKNNIKTEALGFVQEYLGNSEYVNGHDVPKQGDIIGAYYPEVEAFAKEHLHSEMYGFPFRWEDYDCFKANIDSAWAKYCNRIAKR